MEPWQQHGEVDTAFTPVLQAGKRRLGKAELVFMISQKRSPLDNHVYLQPSPYDNLTAHTTQNPEAAAGGERASGGLPVPGGERAEVRPEPKGPPCPQSVPKPLPAQERSNPLITFPVLSELASVQERGNSLLTLPPSKTSCIPPHPRLELPCREGARAWVSGITSGQ